MRFAIYVLFAALIPAQTLTETPAPADLHKVDDLRSLERQLLELLADADALKNDPLRNAMANSNLGVIYQDLGEHRKSERYYIRARALLESQQSSPEQQTLWARTVSNLASLYVEMGQTGKAERLLDALRKANLPEGDDTARMRGTVAGLYLVRGRARQAEELYLSLLKYWEQKPNYRDAAVVLNNLGVLAFQRNDPRTAVGRFRQAVEYWRRAASEDHPSSITARANYGSALLATGDRTQALEVLKTALTQAKAWHGDTAAITGQITALYAEALEASGEKKEARRKREEAKSIVSALAASDPAAHTVDILDLAPRTK
jgi:tetratricopeptide (TPR) repeat protein